MRSIDLDGEELSFCLCRVLPDTALVLKEVLCEADRLWAQQLGADRYRELRSSRAGDDFFSARVGLETIPPGRRMLSVRLPFPPGFEKRLRPQVVDYVEELPRPHGS